MRRTEATGIEIKDGNIRLIKWTSKNEIPLRQVLEEISLDELARAL